MYPIWCGLVPIYQSVFFLVSSAGHQNVCTEVKIRNGHSSCMLSIFERQCHRQSKVVLHWRDVLSLYQSNRGAQQSHYLTSWSFRTPTFSCKLMLDSLHVLVGAFDNFVYDVEIHFFRYASSFVYASLAWDVGPGIFFTLFFPLVLALGAICVFLHLVSMSLPI